MVNGRCSCRFTAESIFDPATGQALVPRPPILFNLESGEQTVIPPPPTGTFAIASDGTVVVNNPTPSSGLDCGVKASSPL